jgi:hypothetical protein
VVQPEGWFSTFRGPSWVGPFRVACSQGEPRTALRPGPASAHSAQALPSRIACTDGSRRLTRRRSPMHFCNPQNLNITAARIYDHFVSLWIVWVVQVLQNFFNSNLSVFVCLLMVE